jgi:hypothetical protein
MGMLYPPRTCPIAIPRRQLCLSIQMTAATQKTRLKIIAAGPYTQYSYVVVKKII